MEWVEIYRALMAIALLLLSRLLWDVKSRLSQVSSEVHTAATHVSECRGGDKTGERTSPWRGELTVKVETLRLVSERETHGQTHSWP